LYTFKQFILILIKQMNPKEKAAIATAGTFGVVGASILAFIGNPVAWGVLIYATYRIAKSAYAKAQTSSKIKGDGDQGTDLFI
jgi:hypothetical protein